MQRYMTRRCLILAVMVLSCQYVQIGSAQFVRPTREPQSKGRRAAENRPATSATKKDSTPASADPTAAVLRENLALQLALERDGFSPGILDAEIGRKTRIALAAYQAFHGREPTGVLDDETRLQLGLGAIVPTRTHTITAADVARVGPCPTDWVERSRAARLPFPTLLDVLIFEGHCSTGLLRRLNPGVDLDALKPGAAVELPHVQKPRRTPEMVCIDVDFENKLIACRDSRGRIAAIFHCSIARERANRPNGECRVNAIAMDPEYTFRPESWPEVKGIDRVLVIPPGPRNPVGLCWIDLSIDGYGIHGTPEPEMIGKTGSHGCIRLTNWDVLRLARMIRPGIEVRFLDDDAQVAAR